MDNPRATLTVSFKCIACSIFTGSPQNLATQLNKFSILEASTKPQISVFQPV